MDCNGFFWQNNYGIRGEVRGVETWENSSGNCFSTQRPQCPQSQLSIARGKRRQPFRHTVFLLLKKDNHEMFGWNRALIQTRSGGDSAVSAVSALKSSYPSSSPTSRATTRGRALDLVVDDPCGFSPIRRLVGLEVREKCRRFVRENPDDRNRAAANLEFGAL